MRSQSVISSALLHGRTEGERAEILSVRRSFGFPEDKPNAFAGAMAALLSVIALPAWRKPALLLSNRSFELAAPSDREVQNFHFDSAPAPALAAGVNNLERRFYDLY
jgi:hypothetical protein